MPSLQLRDKPYFFKPTELLPVLLITWLLWAGAPARVFALKADDGAFHIQFEKGNILFTAKQASLQNILTALKKEFQVQFIGLDDRSAAPVTYTVKVTSLQDLIRGLMRHLDVKNYALEDTDGKLTRVSVFPEARRTASSEPAPPPFEAAEKADEGPEASTGAVEVQSIVDDSQAQTAGLEKGDIILEYGSSKITRAAELVKESQKKPPEEEVDLLIIREGEQMHVTVSGGFIGVRIKTVNLPAEPGTIQ